MSQSQTSTRRRRCRTELIFFSSSRCLSPKTSINGDRVNGLIAVEEAAKKKYSSTAGTLKVKFCTCVLSKDIPEEQESIQNCKEIEKFHMGGLTTFIVLGLREIADPLPVQVCSLVGPVEEKRETNVLLHCLGSYERAQRNSNRMQLMCQDLFFTRTVGDTVEDINERQFVGSFCSSRKISVS